MQSNNLARTVSRSIVRRSTASRAHSTSSARTIASSSGLLVPGTRRQQTVLRTGSQQCRTFFNIFRSSDRPPPPPPPPQPLFSQDDLFHVLDQSPVIQLQRRAKTIKSLAPCPTCLEHAHAHSPNQAEGQAETSTTGSSTTTTESPTPRINKVDYSCFECGFPTHCSEGHYLEGREAHDEYCSRLREINEDEHDLRSGRLISEFELPGEQDYETSPALSNWDTLLYTRNFSSTNSERAKRHVSKLLTYPMTMASVMHRLGPYAGSRGGLDGRLTAEGSRSMAALHTSLHPPMGSNPTANGRNTQTPIRIFVLGARAESALPPHVYEQVCHLFPYTQFHFYFVGPQAALPTRPLPPRDGTPASDAKDAATSDSEGKRVYDEKTPSQNSESEGRGRSESVGYGVPAYTVPVSSTLTLTTLQSSYESVHEQFGPFDPYTDVFFAFCPGFGFPSPTAGRDAVNPDGSQIVQAQLEWKETLQQVLTTKCPLFVTGFSPRDVERDVNSLDSVDGVKGEYDILLRPGENPFGSLKWEAGDFDPRVMVRVNWGVWAMRGKSYDVDQSKIE